MADRIYTTVEILQELDVEITSRLTWSLGGAMERQWLKAYGALPPKDNRPKTSGKGSHCFALYPYRWLKPRVVAYVASEVRAKRAQGGLFDGGAPA